MTIGICLLCFVYDCVLIGKIENEDEEQEVKSTGDNEDDAWNDLLNSSFHQSHHSEQYLTNY